MIFVDTWAWLALAHRRDPYHGIAVKQHGSFQQENQQYVTSDFVLRN
jgi:predicted nucleic acid-binding protein